MDDRQIGAQAALHHIGAAVEDLGGLALGDLGADPGRGEEGRHAGATGADAFGQGALRVELDFQLTGEVLLREGGVFADIGADHLLHLPRDQQQAETGVVDAGVVGDDGEVLDPAVPDRLDQRRGDAAEAEAAGHDRHAVAQQALQSRLCVGIHLVDRHPRPPWKPVAKCRGWGRMARRGVR